MSFTPTGILRHLFRAIEIECGEGADLGIARVDRRSTHFQNRSGSERSRLDAAGKIEGREHAFSAFDFDGAGWGRQ
jgi:hypothetical protein